MFFDFYKSSIYVLDRNTASDRSRGHDTIFGYWIIWWFL